MSSPKFSALAFSGLAFAVAPDPEQQIGEYARMMFALFPQGRLWDFVTGTIKPFVEGFAVELGRVHERVDDVLTEADPTRMVELIDDYERELGLSTVPTLAERQARVQARLIARQRFRPADFVEALAPLLGSTVVIERSRAQAIAFGDEREIFRFFIYRNPSDPGLYYVTSAQELVTSIKPSHTIGHVIESISARYDDSFSLYDRDILGA